MNEQTAKDTVIKKGKKFLKDINEKRGSYGHEISEPQ